MIKDKLTDLSGRVRSSSKSEPCPENVLERDPAPSMGSRHEPHQAAIVALRLTGSVQPRTGESRAYLKEGIH